MVQPLWKTVFQFPIKFIYTVCQPKTYLPYDQEFSSQVFIQKAENTYPHKYVHEYHYLFIMINCIYLVYLYSSSGMLLSSKKRMNQHTTA